MNAKTQKKFSAFRMRNGAYVARFRYGWFDSICGGVSSESGDPPEVVSGNNASPYSNAFDMNLLIAPRYASPTSCLKINLKGLHQPGAS